MISLKNSLPDDGAAVETLLRVVRLLLTGIEQHAIEGDPDDRDGFRTSIAEVTGRLDGDCNASELLVHIGSTLHMLEDYNRRTARFLRRPAGEWQAAVTMLISAIVNLNADTPEKTARLREIAGRVRSAASAEEAHKIRLQLVESLTELQLDTRRQNDAETAAAPEAGLAGFASRSQAEEALAGAWQSDPPGYVAVIAVERLRIFNMRFGHSVGDEVLRFYGEFLRARLRPGDQIFYWSEAVLVALLPRANRLEIVRDEVARLMDARCEHTVQTASRTVLLPITARWTVFPSIAAPRLLIHKIDAFASHGKASPAA
ncbi:MAG TPA: diguanylate cyclase [Bryobacteraceae bacterium]|nr:diguanylate cyclase [Bryobacteraceae bacterium]